MNWFKEAYIHQASPYSENICPWCTSSLILDLFYEKGQKYNNSTGVGKCPVCHKSFKSNHLSQEQMMNFRWSNLEPISEGIYNKMLSSGSPELLAVVAEETEQMAMAMA